MKLLGVTMDLEGMPILNGLYKYMKERTIQFHMPGHKGNINNFDELKFIQESLYEFDKTEVPGLDNLHLADGMIKQAQQLAAHAFGAQDSYFLVNGSTCGIYSMIMGVTKPGDRILIQRNCHRSVFMAGLLGGLEAVYVEPDILEEFNIPGGISLEAVKIAIAENRDIKVIVLTNPSYYGICSDLEGIINEAHEHNILVLIDEAHGAHLPFHSSLPKSAMECGADAAVVSIHKSLPALTQASLLNVSTRIPKSGIEFMLKIFQSTSPSYILMASIDAARNIMQHQGEELLNKLEFDLHSFRKKVEELKSFKLLSDNYIGHASIANIDWTKIVIASSIGGSVLEHRLRTDYNIQVEMSDINNVVLITGIGDNSENIERLYEALHKIDNKSEILNRRTSFYKANKPRTCLNIKDAYYSKKKNIKLRESSGKISGEMVVPYPPGIPILLPGELITDEILENIKVIKENGITISGMEDATLDSILVIDN